MINKKNKIIFQLIVCIFICAISFLTAVLNACSFVNNCIEAAADNNAVILSSITSRIEYGLKYGRELENYYDIDDIADRIKKYCDTDYYYITDMELKLLYGKDTPENIVDMVNQMEQDQSDRVLTVKNNNEYILLTINSGQEKAGYIGISYPVESVKGISDDYTGSIYLFAIIEAVIGIILFELLFHIISHNFDEKKLKRLILAVIIAVNAASIAPMYFILSSGYETLSENTAGDLLEHSADDIDRLIDSGVYFSDMKDSDEYFAEIAGLSEQVSSISLTEQSADTGFVKELPADGEGRQYYLTAYISREFVSGKVTSSVLNVIVTTITAVMIAVEVLLFLLDILIGEKRDWRKLRKNDDRKTIELVGIVRGLSFFFAGFRYMSIAFMSIVLAEIYKPVEIFGWQIPFEILMSLPLSAQVFISMITSYISGVVINKNGWKKATLGGIIVMAAGTLASAFATEPVPFILAQMVVGTGLGFAKMGIDIYPVVVSSEKNMSFYTSSANAGIIVGFSCSAALGAMIASIFGYSGAYIVMTCIGAAVFLLIYFFGANIAPQKSVEEADTEVSKTAGKKTAGFDIRFPVYIMFIIIPYFFIMMFVDYFFPVYANSQGITTDVIGYVMLIYGIATAYIGTPLCPRLTERVYVSLLMPVILLILAAFLLAFSVYSFVIMAGLLVVLIGIADGIMPSLQFMYVYELPFSKRVGFSKAIGIEGFFSSMIGAAAPVIFGIVMLYGSGGLMIVAVLTAGSAVLFAFLNGIQGIKGGIKGSDGGKK